MDEFTASAIKVQTIMPPALHERINIETVMGS